MFDLREDGTITIKFRTLKEPVVLDLPDFGWYEFLYAELLRMNKDNAEYRSDLEQQDPKLENEEIVRLTQERTVKSTVDWWDLVFHGDRNNPDSQKLALSEVPPPENWPAYLIYGSGAIVQCIQHWRGTPLAHGGTPVPRSTKALEAEIEARIATMMKTS